MSNVYGIDIGTSNFKMCCKEKDTILNEKNIIAIANKKDLLAFGDEAYEMYEKAPENIDVSFPVKFGVIADIENMQTLLLNFFNKVNGDKKNTGNNDFYIAVPTDVTEVEKRAFYELVADSKVKAKNIYIVDKPVADAIGAGLDVTKSRGIMMVNIGAETTEISVLSLGGIVISKSIKIGGNKLDDCIINNVKKVYNHSIMDAIKVILERTPPELAADIIKNGVYVSGGTSQINNLEQFIKQETNLNVNIVDQPSESVVRGLIGVVNNPQFSKVAYTPQDKNYD